MSDFNTFKPPINVCPERLHFRTDVFDVGFNTFKALFGFLS